MLAKVYSGALVGVEAAPVEVEVNSGESGEPRTFMVGLPDAAVKESQDRVNSALANSGFSVPHTKMTINLAPGDLRKEGPIYDLPIALGILASTGRIAGDKLSEFIVAGELSLSGNLRAISGGVSLALLARKRKMRGVILPRESAFEAVLVEGVEVVVADSLAQICDFLNSKIEIEPLALADSPFSQTCDTLAMPDFADVKGQFQLRRAVEVAVAGGHNLLMVGPPGSGKSMIAKRIPSIMPLPTLEEFLEVLGIYSAAGLSRNGENRYFKRPFRSPHHTISDVGLIGGGAIPKPGEISLAHNGVLFLDELPEFSKTAMEILRQPLEDGKVTISRVSGSLTYPCEIMLIAAMNPCPCGYFGSPNRECSCSKTKVHQYLSRVSGPLLDRLDLHIDAMPVEFEHISSEQKSESSAAIKLRVNAAREIQNRRFSGTEITCNARITPSMLQETCRVTESGMKMLKTAFEKLGLSARAYDRILKVSRTIADLDGSGDIDASHIAEAIQYRSLDRKYWSN